MAEKKRGLNSDELLVGPGLYVRDLKTTDQCDDAIISLKFDIDKIKDQLDDYGTTADSDWTRKARSALTLKQAAIMATQNRRAKLRRMNTALLDAARVELGEDRWNDLVEMVKKGVT